MVDLYPLKFEPIFKPKIWGGKKLKSFLNKDIGDLENCGESWEISGVPGDISIVKEGPLAGVSLKKIIEDYGSILLGETVIDKFGKEFPLLIKFIDAQEDLSVQVHPNDELAKKRHGTSGKTEMWYILQADKGSTLIAGFNRTLTRKEYLEAFSKDQLMSILNTEEVQAGDVFYLPAGRVHTIGKGLLLAEIQQTSDVTYRIYDFDRVDDKGNTRELHTELALDALDFNHHEDYKTVVDIGENSSNRLVESPYFETYLINGKTDTLLVLNDGTFNILICTDGSLEIKNPVFNVSLQKGETALIPANFDTLDVKSAVGFQLLQTFVPGGQ